MFYIMFIVVCDVQELKATIVMLQDVYWTYSASLRIAHTQTSTVGDTPALGLAQPQTPTAQFMTEHVGYLCVFLKFYSQRWRGPPHNEFCITREENITNLVSTPGSECVFLTWSYPSQ